MNVPPLLVKLNRATKHIEDLQSVCEAFFNSRPYTIETKDDAHTRDRSYYLVGVRDIPDDVVAICGDALHNLRSALDHLASRLVQLAGNAPSIDTCFPIADTEKKYGSAETRRKVKGMRQDAIDAMDALKPYKGGNDTLWRLHRLNAIDKHRFLVTIGTAHVAHSMTPSERAKMGNIYVKYIIALAKVYQNKGL